jgi:hypothetical protein
MKSLISLIGVCVALGLGAQAWNLQAATTAPDLTQNAVADDYVRDGGFAAKNYGTDASLISKTVNYAGYSREIYLKFDLSALTPNYHQVKLRLFGSRAPQSTVTTTESARGLMNDAWTESALTWNQRPTPGALLSSVSVSGTKGQWYEWDVTAFVQARKAAGSKFASLAIVMDEPPANGDGYDVFNSRNAGSNQPQLVFSAAPAEVTTVAFDDAGDTYVRDGSEAGKNFGTEDALIVKNVDYAGYTRQASLKFNLGGVPHAFQKVVLRVYGSRDPGSIITTTTSESVYAAGSSAWTETALTWNNRPPLGAKLDTATISGQTPQWYEWDVTSFVTAQLKADASTADLAMTMDAMPANGEAYDVFQSRESGNAPQLVFSVAGDGSVLLPPTATPTPAPSPTATPVPTATPQPSPVATPVPTATPQPSPTATPIPTPTPQPSPTATPPVTAGKGTDFYIDALSGNDGNSGFTASTAWKSLAPVNATTFDAGDRILFRSGTRYPGHLQLQGSGTAAAPIIVSSYGTGAMPAIDGNGLSETLLLQNEQYWEISNLEITNTGATAQAGRNGVLVQMQDYGTAHHIVLNHLYIHDVNGSVVKGAGGGQAIYLVVAGHTKPSHFDDLQVKNCHIVHCDRTGINMYNDYCSRDLWNPSLHVLIDGNSLEDIGGDGIVIIGCDGALVQNNVLKGGRTRAADSACGIWPWSSDNTVLQFNEVSGMVGLLDGQAYDCDYNCQGTIYQYNYSHDNAGGFMLLCTNGSKTLPSNIGNLGAIVRYNISQNDGCRSVQIIGPVKNAQIYNNVIYTSPSFPKLNVVRFDPWGAGYPSNIALTNNIFQGTSDSQFKLNNWTGPTFTSNCFNGVFTSYPADSSLSTADPQFVAPGKGGSGWNTLAGYKLKDTSPCIGKGTIVKGNGGDDFWGVAVDQTTRPSLGADNN